MTVVIPVCGDLSIWGPLAQRAAASVENQTRPPTKIECVYGDSVASARNFGLVAAQTDKIIFLDADDTLDPHYIEEMYKANGDIRRPSTLGVYPDGSEDDAPVMIPRSPIKTANFIVIGAMLNRDMVMAAGGFACDLAALEDWDLFIHMILRHNATVGDAPGAIYRVSVRPDSRNNNIVAHSNAYREIVSKYASL